MRSKYFHNGLNVFTTVSGWISTTVLTVVVVMKPYISRTVHVAMTVSCFAVSMAVCVTDALHLKYKENKAITKVHNGLRRLRRFLEVNVMFFGVMKGLIHDVLSIGEYPALAISLSASVLLALWRAYDSKPQYWVANSVASEHGTSYHFSSQGFSKFTQGHVAGGITDSRKTLLKYLRTEVKQQQRGCAKFDVFRGSISYAAEVSGTAGLGLYTANTLSAWRNAYLNLGISAFFFMVGSFVGFKIKDKEALSHGIDSGCALSNVAGGKYDQEWQDHVSEARRNIHANFMVNLGRFAKTVEFSKTDIIVFMGLMFTYASLFNTREIPEAYVLVCGGAGFMAAVNSVWKVKHEMKSSSIKVEEVDEEAAASGAFPPATLPIATPQKKVLIDGQHLTPDGSPEGLVVLSDGSSSASDSPPRSLPAIPVTPVTEQGQTAIAVRVEEVDEEAAAKGSAASSISSDSPPREAIAVRPNSVAGTMPPSEEKHHWYNLSGLFGSRSQSHAVGDAALKERLIPVTVTSEAPPPPVHHWYDRFFGGRNQHHHPAVANVTSQNFVPVSAEISAQPIAAGV